jgi:hypothetical protein
MIARVTGMRKLSARDSRGAGRRALDGRQLCRRATGNVLLDPLYWSGMVEVGDVFPDGAV